METMQTVIEHPTFIKQAAKIWSESELHTFIDWIAANPLAGDVIQGSKAGARKIRWHASGRGKRGGARVIYYNLAEDGVIVLVMVYTKNERDNVTAQELNKEV
jgi:mRNA-degrading endonuclease RelE of RelBE toxin-antitoxin system